MSVDNEGVISILPLPLEYHGCTLTTEYQNQDKNPWDERKQNGATMAKAGAINVICKIYRGWQTATIDLLRNNETSNYGPPLHEREPLRYSMV